MKNEWNHQQKNPYLQGIINPIFVQGEITAEQINNDRIYLKNMMKLVLTIIWHNCENLSLL